MLPVNQFKEFIVQQGLFGPHDMILAAVSGGIDSVVMVHLLKSAGFVFGIAHCNFQLRGTESAGDQDFCRSLAAQLKIPFHTISFETLAYAAENKVSTQMAARDLRYQWFEQVRQQAGYTVIALAHHQNDAMETILLNLTRGTGIAGLHGILPRAGRLVRPLLFLNRAQIEAIIKNNGFSYVEDCSNASSKYARNKIRLEVIPKLKELNPSLEQTFEHNLQHFKDLETLLDKKIGELKGDLFKINADEIRISISPIKELVPQKLLLFNLLRQFGVNDTIVNDIIASLDKHSGRSFETASHRIILNREQLVITPNKNDGLQPVKIEINDAEARFGKHRINVVHEDHRLIIKDDPMMLSVDRKLLIYPLNVRAWQKGDFFYPFGMNSRKKVSDFFINQKVPLHQKEEIPIVVNGNGEIIWIAGYRSDGRYKITANTEKVTIFELVRL